MRAILILIAVMLALFSALGFQHTQEASASPPSIRVSPLVVSDDILSAAEVGDLISISYDANDPPSGNAMPVRIDGVGSATYQLGVLTGATSAVCPIAISDVCDGASELLAQPGNNVPPTRVALEARLNGTPDGCSEFEEAFLPNYSLRHRCDPFRKGYEGLSRVIVLPLIDELCNGLCVATVTDIGVFFLEGVGLCTANDCQISLRLPGTLLTGSGRPSCGVHLLHRLGVPAGRVCGQLG